MSRVVLERKNAASKVSPALYWTIGVLWIASICWFHPRLWQISYMGTTFLEKLSLIYFIIFVEIAWLYGIYNVCIIGFAAWYKKTAKPFERIVPSEQPPVALLYTTCNDLVPESLQSCINQDYANFTVYILDDGNDASIMKNIDAYVDAYPKIVKVIRRSNRKGFKAGNLNHALKNFCFEKYFAIADADEILPVDFLTKLVPIMEADEQCGFAQANHIANPDTKSKLGRSLGIGIDLHWKWYQPLRNRFGFVLFLGHGALLRRNCWQEAGGFPEIVSEDLAFAIRIRELGYRGKFIEDVICYEDFPETVRAFRTRHMKWTRGNCEFLAGETAGLVKSKNITVAEKLDILFPTLNLPLTLFYFLFMIDANIIFTWWFGHYHPMTIQWSGHHLLLPSFALDQRFAGIFTKDFFFITMLTFLSPILCFIISLWKQPLKLLRFLCHSTTVYASLSTLSAIGVLSYLATKKATFLVTGDKAQLLENKVQLKRAGFTVSMPAAIRKFLRYSHPDQALVRFIEIGTGVLFAIVSLFLFQISFLGLCLAFIMLPLLHQLNWGESRLSRIMVYLPFLFILLGIVLSVMNLMGVPTIFFGYGFHF